MTVGTWVSLVLVCMLGAMSPGPSLAVVLKHSLHGSMKNGMLAAVSHGIGVGIYAAASLLGLGALMMQFPTVYKLLVYLGAAYLAYLGIRILTTTTSKTGFAKVPVHESSTQAIRDGFAIAFLNPKLAIFFLALFSQFINPETITITIGMIMCLTVLVIDTGWYLLVAMFTEFSKSKFGLTDQTFWLDKILGVVFIGLALRVVFSV